MTSRYKDKDAGVVLTFNGRWISWAHTCAAYAAFLSALAVGISLHYQKIVQNEWFGYPEEWFPSVSATIGDRFPERSFFMLFIALTSGPRFALVGLWYLLTASPNHSLPKLVLFFGIFRTFTCGGWTYVTSTDNHDWHDILMISYLVATIPWMFGCLALSPANAIAIKYRKYTAGAFFGTIVPLVFFFIKHKVYRIPGAYTIYAFFEWSLVLFDVAFDAVTALDFDTFELVVKDVKGISKGTQRSTTEVTTRDKDKQATSGILSQNITLTDSLDSAAAIYHGFVFWSALTSLGLTVWYFPLWHMGISGYEAFVMSTISPFLLAVHPIRITVVKNLRLFHMASLVGLLAFAVPSPVYRLFTIGFGVALQCLAWAATFYSDAGSEDILENRVLAFVIGLLMSSIAKFAWHTNNPIWPIMHAENGGWNITGLLLGIVAALRFTSKVPVSLTVPKSSKKYPTVLYACALGGLLFALHSLLSDTSTMILWVWEGYPIRGPLSNVHAYYTIFAMTAGIVCGVWQPDMITSWSAFGIACLAAAALTLYGNWFGYYGGLVLAAYLMAFSIPLIMAASKQGRPAATFGLGFFIYNFLVLFHVWVVAYAFVPGGPLVREHTDWIMAVTMGLIACGVINLKSERGARFTVTKYTKRAPNTLHRKPFFGVTAILNILFLCAAFRRFPTNDYKAYHGANRVITAGIWTIHFSLDNDMWSSERRMRDLIKETELDVVGLLESDLQRIIMGNRDTTQYLAEDLGMYVDYGPGPNKHTWGAALLSKFPIVNSTHHLLPSPVGELAPAIHATLDVYGTLVDVFVFHSGQEEDPEDRRLQSQYLAKLMGSSTRPSFLLSYLVTKPLEGNYNTYVSETSGMHDVDPSDWDRWCEYILFKGLQRVGYARISRSTITDTELQVAKFVVPESQEKMQHLFDVDDNTRNRRVAESQVPEGWRFPAMFRGEGVRGHRYHVFDEPRYYNY